MKKTIFLFAAISIFSLAACNSDDSSSTKATENAPTEKTVLSNDVVLNAGDNMKYDQTEIHVKSGEIITLTLNHTGKGTITAMGHNFVLLKEGVDMTAFDTKALTAKETDYIPKDSEDVIAHTKLLGGGESDVISFTAPAPGTYTYLCSFPGHGATMNGKFIVE